MTDATYRQLIDVAFDAASRASLAMSRCRFTNQVEARDTVDAYHDFFAAISSHLKYLTHPQPASSNGGDLSGGDPLLAHAEKVLAERARRHPTQSPVDALHPAARAWRQAAVGVRTATDLLDTHRGPDHGWRTPDAELLDNPQTTAAAVNGLADLVRAVASSGQVLALRAREVIPGDTETALYLNRTPLLVSAASLRDYAQTRAGTPGVDELQPAHTLRAPTPAATPLGPAVAAAAQLRQQAWEHTRDPHVSIRTLRAFAAAAVLVHEHVAALSTAAASRWPEMTARQGEDAANALRAAATTSRQAANSWRQIHQYTQVLHSTTPPTPAIGDQLAALHSALQDVTRRDGHWRSPDDLLPDLRSATALLEDARELANAVRDIAGWHRHVAGVLATNRLLYAPATQMSREDVSDDPELVLARLARKLAPIPHRQAAVLLAAYGTAERASHRSSDAHAEACARITTQPGDRTPRYPESLTPATPVIDAGACHQLLSQLAPGAAADPHAPVLLAALAAAAAAGHDPAAVLRDIIAAEPVPASHPARTLHFRLAAVSDAAIAPLPTPRPDPAAADHAQRSPTGRSPVRLAPRR